MPRLLRGGGDEGQRIITHRAKGPSIRLVSDIASVLIGAELKKKVDRDDGLSKPDCHICCEFVIIRTENIRELRFPLPLDTPQWATISESTAGQDGLAMVQAMTIERKDRY